MMNPTQRPPTPGPKTKEEIVEAYRRASIADAAIAVIADKGVDDATIDDIAHAAGVAKGTVYLYFRNRDELITTAAARAFDKVIEDFEITFAPRGTLPERLTRVVEHPLEFVDENVELLRAVFQLREREPRAHESAARMEEIYLARLEQMFANAQERGEMRSIDCAAVAAAVLDCVRGMINRRLRTGPSRRSDEEAASIVSLLLRGIETVA